MILNLIFKCIFSSDDLDQEGIETYLGLPREKFQSENGCEKLSQTRQNEPYVVT